MIAPPEADASLKQLQTWMLHACTAPGGRSQEAPPGCQPQGLDPVKVVKGSNRWPAEARLDIYARGYLARLLEVLRAQFPVLRAMVGDQVFDLFAQGYVWSHPPGGFSLDALGAGFSAYLERGGDAPEDALERLPAELARLEQAMFGASRGRGTEDQPPGAGALSLLLNPGVVLRMPDTTRLLASPFEMTEAVGAVARGLRPDPPAAARTFYAVARRRYRVSAHGLTPLQYDVLQACSGRETSLGTAVTAAAAGRDPTETMAALVLWLPYAIEARIVAVAP